MRKIKDFLIVCLFYLFRIVPINNRKIIVSNHNGMGYGGEGKNIVDYLKKHIGKIDIVWVVKNKSVELPEGIRGVRFNSIRWIYEYATAKIWIDNRRKNIYFRKRKNQYYIQTWHGAVCIKAVEKDAEKNLPERYVRMAINDSKMADVFISGCEWRTKNYKNAFWYNGEIIKGDLYGCDERKKLISNKKKEICNYFNIPETSRIVLYAPTFRADNRLDCYDVDFESLIETLQKRFGGEWYAVIRLHPGIARLNSKFKYGDRIKNGSLLPQISDLLDASEILISDYSGVIFEGFYFEKKVILYASDIERYLQEERSLYFDFYKLPSPVAHNNQELNRIVISFNEALYEEKRKYFLNDIGYYQENAIPIIATYIKNKIKA